ncbi:hypothetical protein NP233_g1555 [Leucocoprinus birnbaumii]|uniref:Uncharacterized protein n=1 Tax=Leucocoprinus birnbaumii TaxID=56174 RepID=A0AAD5YZE7_9AGAR|nr:hypothetical protein NP233_g1555 [Leucocoprinus birnbaumii]
MPSRPRIPLSLLILVVSPTFASASGGPNNDVLDSSGSGEGASFYLEPMDAAHFAFCVVFAVVTFLQSLRALNNLRRRIIKFPPSISSLDFSTGFAFPIFLLASTISLTISYILHGIYWGVTNNVNDSIPRKFSSGYFGAWNATGFLADISLLLSILALLSHREKILLDTPRTTRSVKRAADMILLVVLLGLSMGTVSLEVAGLAEGIRHNLYLTYLSFFLFGVLDVAVHSIILFAQSRDSFIEDHSITLCTAFVISPLFFIYAVFPILVEGLLKPDIDPDAYQDEPVWQLAGLALGCITEVIVIQTCLGFGVPRMEIASEETGLDPEPDKAA